MFFHNTAGSGIYQVRKRLVLVCMVSIGLFATLAFSSMNLTYGVNLAGGSFATPYFPTAAHFDYYHSKNLNLIRIPFMWEKMQPTLNGPLSTEYLAKVDAVVNMATARGMKVILDVHNYGKYYSTPINTGAVTYAAFKDFWTKLAAHYNGNSTICGYGLMNEPSALSAAVWNTAAQQAINGIRTVDTGHPIYVAYWMGPGQKVNTDSQNNLFYEAHIYFDRNHSGRYTNSNGYDGEGAYPMIGVDRADEFLNWCNVNKVRGFMGEYGIPKNDARWNVVLNNFMQYLKSNGISGTYWAGGWSSTYILCCDPVNGVDNPQMSVLQNYTTATYAGNFTGDVFNYTGSTTTGNLAIGKKAFTSDDYYDPIHNRWAAIDGNAATYWAMLTVLPPFFGVDLGQNCSVNKFILSFMYNPAVDYQIQSSLDGINFTDRAVVVGNTSLCKTNSIPAVSARYFRVYMTKRSSAANDLARIREFQIIGASGNSPPVVNITSPTNNTVVGTPGILTITANASDNGSITKVEFYRGSTLLGTDITSPYSYVWSGFVAGMTYSLTAKAYDNAGAVTTSSAKSISIDQRPVGSFVSPLSNSVYKFGQTVTLTCSASDSDGSVSKVNFYRDNYVWLGSDTTAPYSITVSGLSNGSHILKALVYDNQNIPCQSVLTVPITVTPTGALVYAGMVAELDENKGLFTAEPIVANRGGVIRFSGADAKAEQMKIYSATGILINTLSMQNGSAEWSLKNSTGNPVSPGIYLGTAMNNGKITTVKVGIK